MMRDFPLTPKEPWVAKVIERFAEDFISCDAVPDAWQICDLLNTTFWASMQTEEGHSVRASLVLMTPDGSDSRDLFRLSKPVELSPNSITKLSASFPLNRGSIAINFPSQGHPIIWGLVLTKPQIEWFVEILGPGYIVIREGFHILAALFPDGKRILFPKNTRLDDEWCHSLFENNIFSNQISFEFQTQFHGFLQVLSLAMVEHQRGGSIVVVNPTSKDWRRAIDFTYKFNKPQEHLSNLVSELREWQEKDYIEQDQKRKAKGDSFTEIIFSGDSEQEKKLHQALRLVGGLTAVDGALVMTTDMKILGYGAKLKAPPKHFKVREWLPYSLHASEPISIEDFGGTRHQSAAQFVFKYPETTILVASQDGRFTIFSYNESYDEALACRVELLLLCQNLNG